MRGVKSILALVAAVLLLAGCGSGSDDTSATTAAETAPQTKPKKPPKEMSVTLDGYSGPENLGILMADWEDYFEEAGLEMTVYSPNEPNRVVEYTAGGSVDRKRSTC